MDIPSFISNFENAIDGIAPGSIEAQTSFQQIPQWDSLALLSLLAMLSDAYQIEIGGAEILSCNTIEELANLVASKQ